MGSARSLYVVLDTAIGPVGVAWKGSSILAIQLPEASRKATVERLIAKAGGAEEGAPPAKMAAHLDRIVRHLAGEVVDLSAIPLDLDALPPFRRAIYELTRAVPAGSVATYGELARRAGKPGAARAVGMAMGSNPFPIVVPCHRVVGADGKMVGFSAHRGVALKKEILAIERAPGSASQLALPVVAEDAPLPYDGAKAVAHLRRADAVLAKAIAQVGPCRLALRPPAETFAALAEAIVYQQLHARAARTIFDRVRAALGDQLTAARVHALADDPLRAAGLSANKLRALRDLAARDLAGEIPAQAELATLDDEAIVERLTAVRGIGRWTVEMLLLFRLGRPDVLPTTDYGVRQGFARAFGLTELPKPQAIAEHGERWRPFRSVASWYLWRMTDDA